MRSTVQRCLQRARLAMGHANLICMLGLALGAGMPVQAQNLSDQPIRIITPYAAGFGFDVTLRRIGPELSKLIGQPVSIENHPMAVGQAASTEAGLAPIGQTFVFALWAARHISFAPGVKVAYEPRSDFVPVLRVVHSGDAVKGEPAEYAGFFVPSDTPTAMILQLRMAVNTVMAQDTLKAWTEVNGDRVAVVDGPGYTRFLESRRIHLKEQMEDKVVEASSTSR
jgi:hypothetical protein